MTQLYQSKIFANGSTTLPQPVRDALGIKVGDRVRCCIFVRIVQALKMRMVCELVDMPAWHDQPTVSLREMQNVIIYRAIKSEK